MFAKFSPDGDARRLRPARTTSTSRTWPSGRVTRLTADGSPTIDQRHVGLGLRGGVRPARRLPLEPRRQATSRSGSSTRAASASSADQRHRHALPDRHDIPYPKAGTTNSAVQDRRRRRRRRRAALARAARRPAQHLRRRGWSGSDHGRARPPAAQPPPEHQRCLARRRADRQGAAHADDEDEAWVDVVDDVAVAPSGELLWLSERDGWRHAYAAPRDGDADAAPDAGELRRPDGRGRRREGRLALLHRLARRRHAALPLPRARSTATARPSASPRRTRPARTPTRSRPTAARRSTPSRRSTSPPVIDLVRLPSHQSVRVLEDNHELAAARRAADEAGRRVLPGRRSAAASPSTAG